MKVRRKEDIIRIVVLVIAVLVFVISLFNIIKIVVNYKKGDKEYAKVKEQVFNADGAEKPDILVSDDVLQEAEINKEYKFLKYDHQALVKINSDAQGYIDIPGIGFQYPIVQGTDNEYYIDHTVEKKYHSYGCLFVDYRIDGGIKAKNPIIYGHNMKSGAMLAGLNKYLKADFYTADKGNQFIYIYCEEGVYVYQIFSVYITDALDKETYKFAYNNQEEYNAYIVRAKYKSRYSTGVDVTADDDIITLSTCYDENTARIIVHAKKLK